MTSDRRALVLAFVLLLSPAALAGTAAAADEDGADPEDQVVLSGTLQVPRGREVGEVVVLRGVVQVEGVVHGDVVVLDGRALIEGQVAGSVVVLDGPVVLGGSAQVRGDVRAGGDVRVADGAEVGGEIRRDVAFTWRAPVDAFGRFATWLAVTVSTLVLGLVVLLVAPGGAEATFEAGRTAPWTSLGWGVALAVALPVLSLVALVTLVGIPLGLTVLLGLGLIGSIGYALAAFGLGRLAWPAPRSGALALAIGWLGLRAVGLLPVVGGVTWALGAIAGVGAATVATWRARGGARPGKHRRRRAVELSEPMREEAGL